MRHSDPNIPSSTKEALRESLASLGLPPGLLSSAYQSYLACESRLWLLDNSSQMKVNDSHVGRGGKGEDRIQRVDNVTRWEELQECVEFHTNMASKCWIPTKYRLVNDPSSSAVKWQKQEWQKYGNKFKLCHGSLTDVPSEMNQIRHVMKNATLDQRQCPLTSCLQSLSKGLIKNGPSISARKGYVLLVICTQGRPTDKDGQSGVNILMKFQNELSAFSKLPVKIIIRLCTDDEKVRDMYNTIDSRFHSIDVLDDFWGEALEVRLHNPWLTYSIGLHRLRESGLAPELMDDLDERPLCLDEIHQLCKMLFIGDDGGGHLPHPQENWNDFLEALKKLVGDEKPQWNPIKKRPTPWISLRKLEVMHGGGKSSKYFRHSQQNKYSRKHRHTTYVPPQEDAPKKDVPQKDAPQDEDKPKQGVPKQDVPKRDTPKSKCPSSQASQNTSSRPRRHTEPHPQKHVHHQFSNHVAPATTTADENELTLALLEVLRRWSHQPPDYKKSHSLQHILVTVPRTFPPTNAIVEPHEYFAKWKTFDEEAFTDESGDKLKELLRRAVRKAKFFLHPDKLPNDLTKHQTLLFKTIWDIIQDREAAAEEGSEVH